MNRDALIVPLLLRRLVHVLAASDLKVGRGLSLRGRGGATDGEVPFPASLQQLESALTAPNADKFRNYERLEILGDSFLKVQQTLHLFVSHPDKQEGWLTSKRNQEERNSTLHGIRASCWLGGAY